MHIAVIDDGELSKLETLTVTALSGRSALGGVQ